jgi:hypothetical protein
LENVLLQAGACERRLAAREQSMHPRTTWTCPTGANVRLAFSMVDESFIDEGISWLSSLLA